MPPRRALNANAPDPNIVNAMTQALTAILLTLVEAVCNPNLNPNLNPNPNPNPNPSPNPNPNGTMGILAWLEKFQKQKPRSFTKAATPAVARDWIAHVVKIFKVLGVGDEFKAWLASYKLEEDAQTWWEGMLEERGGGQFVENLSWANFRSIFFEKYFNSVDKSSYTREYHSIRQRNDEPLPEFINRFY